MRDLLLSLRIPGAWGLPFLALATGVGFFLSLHNVNYHTVGERLYNLMVDWLRFVAFVSCVGCAGAWAYRDWFRKTRRRQNVFLSLAMVFAVYLCLDLTLRLSTPRYYWYGSHLPNGAATAFEPDPILGWRGKGPRGVTHHSFEYRTRVENNWQGMREGYVRLGPLSASERSFGSNPMPAEASGNAGASTSTVVRPKTQAQPRVLFLGDSYAWGYGVDLDQRFDRVCQKSLAETGIEIETVNASLPGYGTDHEYIILQHLGRRVWPSVVVLEFCENDVEYNNVDQVERTYKNYFKLDENGRLVEHSDHHDQLPLKKAPIPIWIKRINQASLHVLAFSHVYRWLYSRVAHSLYLEELVLGRKVATSAPETANNMEEWKITLALMDAIKAECEAIGARLVLLIVPERHTVKYKPSLYYREVLTGFCRERGIPCVDLEADGPFDFDHNCYVMDPHWNWRGHATAARALTPVLEQLLPANPAAAANHG